jgi:hypothetical protein
MLPAAVEASQHQSNLVTIRSFRPFDLPPEKTIGCRRNSAFSASKSLRLRGVSARVPTGSEAVVGLVQCLSDWFSLLPRRAQRMTMWIAMAASYFRIARHGNLNELVWHFGILDRNGVDELSSQYRIGAAVREN